MVRPRRYGTAPAPAKSESCDVAAANNSTLRVALVKGVRKTIHDVTLPPDGRRHQIASYRLAHSREMAAQHSAITQDFEIGLENALRIRRSKVLYFHA